MKHKRFLILAAALSLSLPSAGLAEEAQEAIKLEPVTVVEKKVSLFGGEVSSERMEELQPVDIGDLLKKDVAGVSVIRKAGTAQDPVLRGLSKDRTKVLIDGNFVYGACGNRMDPPTFHVSPYQIERVDVVKGPFDVTAGPQLGGSINIVTKEPRYYLEPEAHAEIRGGFEGVSNGKKGGVSLYGGKAPFDFNAAYDRKDYDGYLDGKGHRVTADFEQENFTAGVGLSLNKDTRLGISYTGQRSDDVFYPTLAMDSPKDDMDMYSADLTIRNMKGLLKEADAKVYYSEVDHYMSNFEKYEYTSPTPTMKMDAPSESRTWGGRVKGTLGLLNGTDLGVDYYNRWWDIWTRNGSGVRLRHAIPDTTITDLGLFVQPSVKSGDLTFTAGARLDLVSAEADDKSAAAQYDTYYGAGTSGDLDKDETNVSAFLKGSYPVTDTIDVYAGIGRGVRTADGRERFRVLLPIASDKFDIGNPSLDPEESLQFEAGSKGRAGRFSYDISAFYNTVKNYIAQFKIGDYDLNAMRPGLETLTGYRNVDAVLYGGELSAGYPLPDTVSLLGSAQYLWGEDTDSDSPLAEIAPLEGKLGVRYEDRGLWVEAMGRFVDGQERDDAFGTDPGETRGFDTYDIRAGYSLKENIMTTAGVENIFDTYYYEHLSKNFAFNQDGHTTAERVPEPGRNAYVNLTMKF
jgi:iron complex outermembrane receptor protein